jgi:predicted molibdopterin-dependent oxidoreductase YjgC
VSPAGREVTITIDGREVPATEGEMLHDAARKGDVEIPYFCYEPKLGDPVGACRMCLVEIEGIPKLQTSCSTPVREGMVVHTRTEQVKEAQNSVVEFLLVNHPLDCPVCDKGGECPLQDISYGWGPGKSRVIDEKRHFEKPIELSPLVAIDRERCILCYRCVRFSQEISEDAQLQLIDRGDRTYVGTFDDRPYVAPFQGNITDICPVGALTNYTYRFRARPWDIEHAGSVCTICPSQCNVSFTVRDEKVKRVVSRDNEEVDDGWLCDRGRYGFEMFDGPERIDGPRLKGGAEASWEQAVEAVAEGLRRAGGKVAGGSSATRSARRTSIRAPRAGPRPSCCGAWPSRRSRRGSATSTTPTRSSSSAPTRCTPRRSSTSACARRSAATAPSWSSRPSARPRSTAAPRRSPATPRARPRTLSPSWRARSTALRTSPPRSPRRCATPRRSSSSGANGSAARTGPPRRCSRLPPPPA